MDDQNSEWPRKGATLTHGTAQKEFGLTYEEIVEAIRAGKLQYRQASIHGNPALRLLRREVDALAKERHGEREARAQKLKVELAGIDRELKRLRKQLAALEERKSKLAAELAAMASSGAPNEEEKR